MEHVTSWNPNTCGCAVEFKWDDLEPGETRKHSFHDVTKTCDVHEGLTKKEVFDVCFSENTRMNITFRELLILIPAISNTNERKQLNDGIEYKWSFSGKGKDRILEARLEGYELSPQERATMENFSVTKFGNNKMKLA